MDQNLDRYHDGAAEITAQMPGKVVRVLVEAGQEVATGAGVLIVEAMKMQNEMNSPRAGVVASVNVSAGDTVEAGQLLATIE
jgi:biotin carboxyl carrier protein